MTTHSERDGMDIQTIRPELRDIDEVAIARLDEEISRAREAGYDVTVGETRDASYDDPSKIREIYDFLHVLDETLADERQEVIRRGLGSLGLNPFGRTMRRERMIDHALDPFRVELLFEPHEAVPWHNQRGRAAALLAIAAAHELMENGSEGSGIYPTMSGPLDARVLTYTFDERAGWLRNLSTSDAIIHADVRFGNRDTIEAGERARARLDDIADYIRTPISPVFHDVVRYCTDGLGIRARKEEVHDAIREHLLAQSHESEKEFLMMSFGCGTALPMLEVVKDLKEQEGIHSRLILLDQDPLALAAAACLAEDMGLADAIEIHCERLFNRIGQPLKLDSILNGRKLDVAEDSGLREYLPSMIYRWLARESWNSLKPGGLMTTGNMNVNRPQAEFLHGMMGWWPLVQKRTIVECLTLHRQAGIPSAQTRVRVTGDGVYSMYFTTRPS